MLDQRDLNIEQHFKSKKEDGQNNVLTSSTVK